MNYMNKILSFTLLLLLCAATGAWAQPQQEEYKYGLDYFMPNSKYSFNKDISTPKDVLGFQLGQQHVDWGQVLQYMYTLAKESKRVSVKEMGRTYQHRPFIEVVITSEENQRNIDKIKEEHLKLSDPSESGSLSLEEMPVVVNLIYSIHGNEPSGVNASLATAYFFAAVQGEEMEKLLENTVIVMTPGANPDGINRFASWVNSSRSLTDVYDLNSREFQEPWPSSRTNHYWADCNRDWLMLQHPEGVNGVETYFDWLPNVVADLHEQGSARPYYFSPGHPKRTHQLTTQLNQDFTTEISSYCAAELDKIGTGYYSKEGYDDYYYGKGAAYGDIHGSICLLYEQGTSRGHLRMTANGIRSFAWTIRNQAMGSYATVLAAYQMKERLNRYQRDYFVNALNEAKSENIKGYVFDTRGSKSLAFHFLDNMSHHRIEVYKLAKDLSVQGKQFKKDDAYIIPVEQKYSKMIKAVMEDNLTFIDSTFYDISAWTFTHAFNLNYAPVKSTAGLVGKRIDNNTFHRGEVIGGKSNYGYLFDNVEFYSHKVIYELQKRGLYVSVSGRPFIFHSGDIKREMGYGTALVMAQNQPLSSEEIYKLLVDLAAETGVDIYAASTGLMEDVDLGSPAYLPIKQPKVAILVGRSMGVPNSGEAWYLLDKRFQMQPVLIESKEITSKKLQPYNTIILANGIPDIGKTGNAALKEWIENGGTLIATGKAYEWVADMGIMQLKKKSTAIKADSTKYLVYADKKEASAGNTIAGVILNCTLDKTHPLGWGLNQDEIAVLKKGNIILNKDKDPYVSPLHYSSKPVLSGFLSVKNEMLLKDTPAVFAKPYKSGKVIVFVDDMNFRSYWFGTSKIFLNAIFFSSCIK